MERRQARQCCAVSQPVCGVLLILPPLARGVPARAAACSALPARGDLPVRLLVASDRRRVLARAAGSPREAEADGTEATMADADARLWSSSPPSAMSGLLFLIAYVSDRAARNRQGGVPPLALHLHARHLGLLHQLDLLRRRRLGGAQRARISRHLSRADAGVHRAGGSCPRGWCASATSSASPRSPIFYRRGSASRAGSPC